MNQGAYVLCIKTISYQGNSHFTAGKVYEVKSRKYDHIAVYKDDKGVENGWKVKYFIELTQEERQLVRLLNE